MSDEDKLAKLKAEVATLRVALCGLLEFLNTLPLGDHAPVERIAKDLGAAAIDGVRHKYPFWHRK